mgnify:CR=1 FL=1
MKKHYDELHFNEKKNKHFLNRLLCYYKIVFLLLHFLISRKVNFQVVKWNHSFNLISRSNPEYSAFSYSGRKNIEFHLK